MRFPTGDCILLEPYNEHSGLVRPETADYNQGDTFIVKATGPGYHTDNGVLIPCECKPGDRVWLAGKILKLPTDDGEKVLIARASDVLMIERGPKEEKSVVQEATEIKDK